MQLIYSKKVDKSVLCDGFTIKTCLLEAFMNLAGKLDIGKSKSIKLLLGGEIYEGITLKNQNFDRNRYPDHPEMYQVRYGANSKFSKALREIYSDVWAFINYQLIENAKLAKEDGRRRIIKIPNELERTIAFYTTELPDVWSVETFGANEYAELQRSLIESKESEIDYERTDETASVNIHTRNVKLRVLDKAVGENLKLLYKHRCQVCGMAVGERYGNNPIVDAHHINPFTVSFNNDYDNIMVLCPNHHRIIHANHGEFQRKLKEVWYPNGYHEQLKLNIHL